MKTGTSKRIYRRLLTVATFIAAAFAAAAVEIPFPDANVWPESPQARKVREVTIPAPAILTGAATYEIPLYTISVEGVSIPIALSYRSNGIRVDDDPHPVGYGWSLTPPLRVVRQIFNRPDEYFEFKGDVSQLQFESDYELAFRCITAKNSMTAANLDTLNRFDTERDIFTLYLPDATLTMIKVGNRFYGPASSEYRVEGDKRLSYIEVTDPHGVIYNFATEGEYIGSTAMRTEWLLSDITLPSGRKIDFGWELNDHRYHGTSATWTTSLIYSDIPPIFSEYAETDLSDYGRAASYQNTKDLKSVTFPGGKATLTYSFNMLSGMTVRNSSGEQVFSATFLHGDKGKTLDEVNIAGTGIYRFEYNPQDFDRRSGRDWWGFYNGKQSPNLETWPTINPLCGPGSHFASGTPIRGADRSVDTALMRAHILEKAVTPTGGILTWEYEPHRFAPQSTTDTTVIARIGVSTLSEGGGLRVKAIAMYDGPDDTSPVTRRYVYGDNGNGLARVIAVPLPETFVSESYICENRYTGSQSSLDACALYLDYYLTVSGTSNYLAGQTGATPLWYDAVTEIHPEGKTEYRFTTLTEPNRVLRTWGKVNPVTINTAFSKGPQLTSKTVYKSESGTYTPVEKTEYTYELVSSSDIRSGYNTQITRDVILLDGNLDAPDFGDVQHVVNVSMARWLEKPQYGLPWPLGPIPLSADLYKWYHIQGYTVVDRTERLKSTVTTQYFPNGSITQREEYVYRPGTMLVKQKTLGNGTDLITTVYGYADSQGPEPCALMQAAGAVGILTEVNERFNGGAGSGYGLQMQGISSSLFRPLHVWKKRGAESWTQTRYTYDNCGNITSATGVNDFTRRTWTWDAEALYPVSFTTGTMKAAQARWKGLVGVSALTDPSGIEQTFTYDNAGRLVSQSIDGRLARKYTYRTGHDGDNRVTTTHMLTATAGHTTVERFDALGRSIGVITAVDGGMVATLRQYDSAGRLSRTWSAAPVTSAAASAEDIAASVADYYGDSRAYAETVYEPSPRAMATASVNAGTAWEGHPATVEMLTNDLAAHSCVRYAVTSTGVESRGNYPPGTLTLKRMTDEDGIVVETYSDLRGLTVCRRQDGQSTAFVYDDFGSLCYVLPPGVSGTHSRDDEVMRNLAFRYDYDSRGRLVSKHIPGAGETRCLYDPADRLTALHTPDQPDGVWTIYGYDACGRKVVEMESGDGDTEVENWAATCHTATLDAASPQEWDTGGYSFSPDCQLHPKATTAWYYDDYSFLTLRGLGAEFRFSDEMTLNTVEAASVPAGSVDIKPRRIAQPSGMLTGIYGVPGYEVYYYDGEGRQIERYATGYNTGRTTTTYTPDGRPLTVSTVYPSGSPYDDFTVQYTYDACGRVTSRKISKASRPVRGTVGGVQATAMTADGGITGEQLSDTARVAVSYDRAGRVARTSLGANASISAAYDVHGWVNGRRFDYSGGTFTETMLYADGATPRFNGFISSRIWDGNRYDYTYDAMGRLVGARYSGTPGRNFTCAYEYDPRGNIQRLMRKGITGRLPSGAETFGDLDIITVTHSGNRPVGFTNEGDNPATFEGRTGAGIHEQAELSYDDAGRVTADTSRGIRRIDYNHRGQPVTIIFDDGHKHTMTYDGRGNLLKTIFYEAVGQVVAGKPTRYRVTAVRGYSGDGQVTVGDSVVMMRFAGGYFDGRGRACYYMPDYQGNNLGVVDADGHLTQRTDYYPYGEAWRQPEADINPWLYSDKELLSVDGQHEYDFGARRYTSGFPMFTTPDQMSEVRPWHSPYLFCGANPVMNTDPTGMNYYSVDRKGYFYLLERNEDSYDRIISDNNKPGDYSNFVQVSKDFFSSVRYFDVDNTNFGYRSGKFHYYHVTHDTDEVFSFLSMNTNVEWSQIKFDMPDGLHSEVIGTSNFYDGDFTPDYILKNFLNASFSEMNHCHGNWFAYGPSNADISMASKYRERSPQCSFSISCKYYGKNEYDETTPVMVNLWEIECTSIDKKDDDRPNSQYR